MKEFKYSWEWSADIVQTFTEKFWRGTDLLAKILEIPKKEVIIRATERLASGNSVRFEAIKRLIKALDKEEWEDYRHLELVDRQVLIMRYLWLHEDETLDDFSKQTDLDM